MPHLNVSLHETYHKESQTGGHSSWLISQMPSTCPLLPIVFYLSFLHQAIHKTCPCSLPTCLCRQTILAEASPDHLLQYGKYAPSLLIFRLSQLLQEQELLYAEAAPPCTACPVPLQSANPALPLWQRPV